MFLEKEIFKEFEDIVGVGNIDDGVVITNVYAYNWCMEIFNYMDGKEPIPFSPIPKAVILPSSTEEVQKIVKLCNKYRIQIKIQSTGLGPWNQPSTDNCIIFDMRRMNKIIKIDEKNLYAVIEPYVSGAQLQVETMKYDLTIHMPGAGPMVSPLASATSMNGPGFTSPCTGHSARNVLAVEWVLPDGEVMKLGSYGLKNNSDWFHGDGPGPSLRGIMRGWAGTKSGLGVFTKVAVKLFPYPCSTDFNVKGNSPNYDFDIPDFMKLYVMDCGNFKKLEDVMLGVEEEEISFMCSYLSGFAVMAIFSNSIESLMDKIPIGQMKAPLVVIITARTKREFAYKQKAMDFLLNNFKIENIIGKIYTPKPIFYAEALRSNLGLHGFIATGGFQSSKGVADTAAVCLRSTKSNIPLKQEFIKKEAIVNDFGEGTWMTSYESGHYFHMESPTMFDQTEESSVKGMAEYMEKSNQLDLLKHLGAPFFVEGTRMHELFGPYMSNYHIWLRKIKETFDPNNISDSGFYISPQNK
ncbi:MAG: FAD-binding oxidoreductase [Candidatus Lokiarchaeota archaeon]|nr:FAD-binding oxidoreductase [Candidatus Lokiarchaeota archaeon]